MGLIPGEYSLRMNYRIDLIRCYDFDTGQSISLDFG